MTYYDSLSASKYTSQNLGAAGVIGWYAFIQYTHVVFNNRVHQTMNTTNTFVQYDNCTGTDDGYLATLHEAGGI